MADNTNTQKTNCLRCGRTLTATTSVRNGYGKGCAARIRKAAADLADYKARQIDQARELIEDGAIVHLRGQVFITVSSDGTETYYSATNTCTCPAGRRGKSPCYHTAAARILLAAAGRIETVRPARTFDLAA